jgi:predicted DsbA family dithiol-disulfide isomerase
MTPTDNIPHLNIEIQDDGLIRLEQQCGLEDPIYINIHPFHLRYLAEKFGIVETSDQTAAKTIATLTRRLLVLSERCNALATHLETVDSQSASPFAQTHARATADIADQFCAELDSDKPDVGDDA